MRIGLVIGLHGIDREGAPPYPTWEGVRHQATAAEEAGFDLVVVEDGLLYDLPDQTVGFWESVSMAGALAASTSTIGIAHSVLNAPYRTPALTAKIAETLDEISAGRYTLGIGAGNTPDYEAFGFPADRRFSRFAEAIEVLHTLLRRGEVDFDGDFQSARGAKMVMRGPREGGPPIVIAAGGPKMKALTATYADGWNWFAFDATTWDGLASHRTEMVRACEETGRDPSTLDCSVDVYSVDPLGLADPDRDDGALVVAGSADQIADRLLGLAEAGFDEVRCDLRHEPGSAAAAEAVSAMGDVVDLVHAG